jgi:hypothetical protein
MGFTGHGTLAQRAYICSPRKIRPDRWTEVPGMSASDRD